MTFWWNLDPWDEMRRLQKSLTRGFDETLSKAPGREATDLVCADQPVSNRNWKPICDVKETDKAILVHTELPGIPKECINVDVQNGMLTISGERCYEKKDENERYHRVERSYGKFSRSMALPEGVDNSKIVANYNNGVLELEIPKPQNQLNRHKIAIKTTEQK